MRTLSRVFLILILLWNLCALVGQPKPLLPDPKLTPGDVFDVTLQDICTPGYSRKVRAVPRSLRIEAYRKYGITSPNPGDYQLDHLIPLCLGGSNSIRNLWPQSYRTSPWNAHVKDVLERTKSGCFNWRRSRAASDSLLGQAGSCLRTRRSV